MKKKEISSEHYLSLDLGNAYVNLRTDEGVTDDWRSIMAPLSDANRLGTWPLSDVMNYEGRWWATGEKCYTLAQDTIEEKVHLARYISPWYRRLFAFALHRAFWQLVGTEIVYPKVISSIPAKLFKNRVEAERIKKNLLGQYRIGNSKGGTLHLNITTDNLTIIPEGIGTYFGYVFGTNERQYENGSWMVADFGYLTLDTVMVRDGDYIPDAAQSDSQTGISIASSAVLDALYSRTHADLDRAYIDENLTEDSITVNGRAYPIADTRDEAFGQIADRATGLLEQWAARQNLSGCILTGGGAEYVAPYIKSEHLPPIVVASDPRRANVDGAYLYITDPGE